MAVQVCIPLTQEETRFQQVLSQKNHPFLEAPNGFKLDIAWELANLTRIAYSDYELFKGCQRFLVELGECARKISYEANINYTSQKEVYIPQRGVDTLEKDDYLYTSSTIANQRIDDYFIGREENSLVKIKEIYGDSYFRYKILSAYNYLSYSFRRFFDLIPIPEIERFGFIAEREFNGDKLIFVVYRGTRELEEWFVNFQFKQRPFLESEKHIENESKNHIENKPEVSLGFNKIYTGFRPGLLHGENKVKLRLNKYSRLIDEKARSKSIDKYPKIHQEHNSIESEVKEVFDKISTERNNMPTSIYCTGHSLGGALSTISALHISQLLNLPDNEIKNRVFLYTFASPRVGNDFFARECNKYLQIYRIANSEDIVPGVPPGTFKIIGPEMLPKPAIIAFRKALSFLTNGVTDDIYEHVGNPICFTRQLDGVTSNHNLNATYCDALARISKRQGSL
ncbi:hypothetical protein [Acaryochloris sp. IP29b_bin.137]|uniref:lipase family protein n=1 Tax=Acaryochloris sp. IP29b_bin.137 TaxID=2969217 RepID=UPI0026219DA7|nr:hypothetical protein [Acaryochloris sp. IP29b_bin.137]